MLKSSIKLLFTFSLLVFSWSNVSLSQGNTCDDLQPFCSDSPESFPAGTNSGSAEGGNDYDCLFSQPNPAWYYLLIGEEGDLDIDLTPQPLVDIDFILYGPFESLTGSCNQLTSANVVDCSYSPQAVEEANIPNAQIGEFYILLITNFSNNPTNINVSQSGGIGETDCGVLIDCDLEVSAGENAGVCLNQPFNLNGSFDQAVGNTTYEWTAEPEAALNDLDQTDILEPTFTPSQDYGDVTFTLTVTDDGATDGPCSVSSSVELSFPSLPTIVADEQVCPNASHEFRVEGTPGDSLVYDLNGEQGTVIIGSDSTGVVTVDESTEDMIFKIIGGQVGQCGTSNLDLTEIDSVLTTIYPIAIDSVSQFPAACGIPNGAVSVQGSGFTGVPEYTWTGPGAESENSINASVWEDLPSGWYYITISDNNCTVQDSVFLEQDPPPTASFDADPIEGNTPLDVNFTNTSDQADTYNWNFGNGQSNSVNDQSGQNTTYDSPGVYTVTLEITKGECSDIATQDIIVTEILPLIFDMPNVFTPNGDGINDVFTINPIHAVGLEMTITNRWGNVVYESDDINGTWNGQNNNSGEMCTEGTYFYTFTITGMDNVAQQQHGFVHLVRD